MREKPAGTVRIAATESAVASVLCPVLEQLLPDHPDIRVELVADHGLTDIVAGHFDAGVRFGETVAQGMIAVRIGPDTSMAVVGTSSYFAARSVPQPEQHRTPPGLPSGEPASSSTSCLPAAMPTWFAA